ncbi:MAG: 5-deoxy-glucuronate isomerase [Chloroflexota bacterium]
MPITADQLHFSASDDLTASVFAKLSAEQAGWQYLNMVALSLETGKTFGIEVGQYEYLAVILGGVCDIHTNHGDFLDVGRRTDVFTGMPYAIYMPRNTEFEITSLTDDFAMASVWAPTDRDHQVKLITPKDSKTQIHGGDSATYQVNTIIEPGFACHRLTAREIYTPGGNWAHYPPHKHDTHTEKDGQVSEVASEELFFYKFDKFNGFGIQRIYTDDGEIDATIAPKHNDVVTVPKGYHTMSSPQGFTTYTLNVTAGTAQSLAHTVDPRLAWIPETWTGKDSRLPIVTRGMEPYDPPA